MDKVFQKVQGGLESVFGEEKHSHSHIAETCDHLHPDGHVQNRFHSFAPQSSGDVKWFVDGCSYFWAVSEALEQAKESIYILDWWLSPELYLRRPPSKNEKYRLDNMLKAAAERGVKVYVIVYKEVEAALTLDSVHTRHALEALHPNIGVFRHPDHTPTGYDLASEFGKSFRNLSTFNLAKASGDALKALYGTAGDVVLFWAHHEKLLVIDQKLGFMGGLDLCFGRWDTNSHPIADAHPGNLDEIIFPGQDFNNARVFDFNNVSHWDQNKLDRTKSSRMGWSDVALNMQGPIVENMVEHFIDRWNFIYGEKYRYKDPGKYHKLDVPDQALTKNLRDLGGKIGGLANRFNMGLRGLGSGGSEDDDQASASESMSNIQMTRSCSKWSSGHRVEHSIANAYIHAIGNAQHFIYIENQFFITATDSAQHPVANKLGAAIVERIIRAHRQQQPFKVWVVMPAVPAFAGDLESDGALGTRAIMEFQYNSISRGGHSIMQKLEQAGIEDPSRYIGFYNLRNFDRINVSGTMKKTESRAGVKYEDARKQHDDEVGGGHYFQGEGTQGRRDEYHEYQKETVHVRDETLDTITQTYMDGGRNVVDMPWDGEPEEEMAAFVSEELYIHSKLLIADDKLVICGSANLNDRSQLGTHDSEIAVVIEDQTPIQTAMNGVPYTASAFASSLRRQIFRKHLGLLPDQRWDRPDNNWSPVTRHGNDYDWGSPADRLVADPMHPNFLNLWRNTAEGNTEVFSRAFHPVPNDLVRTWKDYKEFFSRHFIMPSGKKEEEEGRGSNKTDGEGEGKAGKVEYGHIVPEEFPGGVQECKEWLGRIRGTLVDMPLQFLVDVDDIAKEGLALNSFTEEVYT